MAQGKPRAHSKRNATDSGSPSTTSSKRQRRGTEQGSKDKNLALSTSTPGPSNAKSGKGQPKREPRQAAVAASRRTKTDINVDRESDDEEEEDSDYHSLTHQEQGSESDSGSEEDDAEESSDDDFQEDFRAKTGRSASASKRSTSSKAPSTTSTKSPTSSKSKRESAPLPASKKAAIAKAMSKFKVSNVKIPHPKDGPVADAIQPETLEFIRDLKLNNDREYMMLNQERCDKAKADFMDFVRMVKDGLREADADVMDQEPKDSMMRIYRDVRFSNDKSPYKSQLAAHFSRGGKKSIAAGYFFSVSSENKSFIGCGVWDPSSAVLARIRNGIVEEEERFRGILESDALKKFHKGKAGGNVLLQGNKLKTGPKGFDKDHSAIEFLKLKSFAIGRHFTDLEVVSPGFLEEVLSTFDACVDFVHILNEWIG
ncbi:hypothetical protein DFQ27_007337 [Actinomortierella ambigua]|uniref:DUF2461 domain-containing protein n=1 Tax=Actinomortierella ambigua TaxID=1343610 RepID=A0A9P6U071_9FUNG|nr:hypothetical protein DFQ27_007337 [Actinomortierella ambigua]